MMVWTGAGVLVPFFLIAVIMLFSWLETQFPGLKSIQKNIYFGVQLIIVGVLCYLFDLLLKREKPKIVIDKATGKEIALKAKHKIKGTVLFN